MTEVLHSAYCAGVYDKELKMGRDVWEKLAKSYLKEVEERKTKVKVYYHRGQKK